MAGRVSLIPLVCFKCETPVPANPDEVAWVCDRCGQGMLLDEQKGLIPLDVQYSADIPPGRRGRPFWVAEGVADTARKVYGVSNQSREAEQTWMTPRRFFIPAFNCPLNVLTELAPAMLLHPPELKPGPVVPFEAVTLHPQDVSAVAETIILTIEAGRRDNLKEFSIRLELSPPVLWVLV